jgi:type I restriction enzyme M protein
MTLAEILKDSDYKHAQFGLVQIREFEQKITTRTDKKGEEIPYITCAVRKKEIRLTPEEAVRQLYLEIILNDYKYPADLRRESERLPEEAKEMVEREIEEKRHLNIGCNE